MKKHSSSIAQTALLSTLLIATGCAPLPAAHTYNTEEVPMQQRWWLIYNDAQLNQLIDHATSNAPDMQRAQARLRQAEAIRGVADSAELPQAKADINLTKQQQSNNYLFPKSFIPQGWNGYGNASVQFGWEFDFWGKNKAAIAAATNDILASKAERAHAQLTLASSVAQQYVELTRLYAAYDVAQQHISNQTHLHNLLLKRVNHGIDLQTVLNDAQSQALQQRLEAQSLEAQIETAKVKLMTLSGKLPEDASSLHQPTLKLNINRPETNKVSLNALGKRPDVVAAKMQVEGQLHRVDQKKAEFYPDINLSGFVGFQSLGTGRLFDADSKVGSIGPALSLPLFTAGRLKNDLRYNEAKYDESVALYNKVLLQSIEEVSVTDLNARSVQEQKKLVEALVTERQKAWQTMKQRHQAGLVSDIEVTQSHETLLNSQKQLSDMQSKAISLDIQLQQALGGGYEAPTH
jgi:NodT family efflux transporter outer membrane factor (OMF) lipoprotein